MEGQAGAFPPRTDCLLGSVGTHGRLPALFLLCCSSARLPTLLPGAEVPKACDLLLFLCSCAGRGSIISCAALPAAKHKQVSGVTYCSVGPGQLDAFPLLVTAPAEPAHPLAVREEHKLCASTGTAGLGRGPLANPKEGESVSLRRWFGSGFECVQNPTSSPGQS